MSTLNNKWPIAAAIAGTGLLMAFGLSQCGKTIQTSAPAATPVVAVPTLAERPSDADSVEATVATMAAELSAAKADKARADELEVKVASMEQKMASQDVSGAMAEMTAILRELQTQNLATNARLLEVESARAPDDGAVAADFGYAGGGVPGGTDSGAGAGDAALAAVSAAPSYIWIRPLDQAPAIPGADPQSVATVNTGDIEPVQPGDIAIAPETVQPLVKVASLGPKYTIPANATLLNATALTALIGRVPVNGTVSDPYRFKVLASAQGFAANGFSLPPELRHMVMSGAATGDWGLSCVSGIIDSITFVYLDGSIQSYGSDVASEGTGQSTAQQRKRLGYLSDPSGVPCVKGERVTDAPKILGARFAAAALEATAQGYAEGQTDTVVTAAGGVVRTINDAAKFGAFAGLAGGAADSRAWLESRLSQYFDVVYAPPSQTVAIHMESQINLDQLQGARKLSYDSEQTSTGLD